MERFFILGEIIWKNSKLFGELALANSIKFGIINNIKILGGIFDGSN